MSGQKSRKNSLKKNMKKNIEPLTSHQKIASPKVKLSRAEEKLVQYELAFLIHKKLIDQEELMGIGYKEELFDAQMRSKYHDADQLELQEKGHHYKLWQYIIHFSEYNEVTCLKLREVYQPESERQKCHKFCLHMDIACTLFSSQIFIGVSEQVILGKKRTYDSFTKEEIIKNLSRMFYINISPVIKTIVEFLEIHHGF